MHHSHPRLHDGSSLLREASSLHATILRSSPRQGRKRNTHSTLSLPLLDSTTPDKTFNLSIVPSLAPIPSCCTASLSFPFLDPVTDGTLRCRGLVGTVYAGSDDVLAWGSVRHGSVSSAWVRERDILCTGTSAFTAINDDSLKRYYTVSEVYRRLGAFPVINASRTRRSSAFKSQLGDIALKILD